MTKKWSQYQAVNDELARRRAEPKPAKALAAAPREAAPVAVDRSAVQKIVGEAMLNGWSGHGSQAPDSYTDRIMELLK